MNRRTWIWTLGVLALFGSALFLWNRSNTHPPAWDESVHLHLALDYKNWLVHGDPVTSSWATVYPPLYHLSLIPSLSWGTPSEAHAVYTHLFYALIFILGCAWLARGFGGFPEEGVLAAFFVLGSYFGFHTARHPLIDFALMAWVSVGMALLWHSRAFADKRMTLLWAVWSGLGMMLKPFYAMWFVLPCVLLLWEGPTRSPAEARPKTNFLLALIVILLAMIPYYGWQGPLFFRNAIGLAGEMGIAEGDPSFTSWAGWFYYVQALWVQLGPLSLAFLLTGIGLLVLGRKGTPGQRFLSSWILSGYLAFTLVRNKDWRYTLPLVPALGFFAVRGFLSSDRNGSRKSWILALLAGVFVVNGFISEKPVREDWHHRELGQLLAQRHDTNSPFLIASVLDNQAYFFGRTIRWTLRTLGIQLDTASAADPVANFTEYIVQKPGDLGPSSSSLLAEWARLQASGRAFTAVFPEVAQFPLPDRSVAHVFRRDPAHRFEIGGLSAKELENRLHSYLATLIDGPFQVKVIGKPEEFQRGRLESVEISGGPWKIREIPIREATLRLEKVWLNLYQLWDHQKPGVLAVERIEPHIVISARDIEGFLRRKARELKNTQVHFANGLLSLTATFRGLPVEALARVDLESQPRQLVATLVRVKMHGITLPGWILGKSRKQILPLVPIPSFPVAIQIGRATVNDDFVKIDP